MELIREVGANTIRLAHYQHNQYFYDLCDKYGMVVWAEIPYISAHMPGGRENTFFQMRELIVQNYNHPCIVTWGISNEITISGKHRADMLDNHHALQKFCKELDPTRPTTLACYAMCHPFHPVTKISDVVAWNLYLGWYVPGLFLNDWFMKFYHWKYPKRALGYSEYGAEGMPNLHSARPRRGDHTEEYQAKYHEYMLECFDRHPFLWSTYVWNMFDFAADARDQGGEPGMNHKGLVTFDRKTKKDSFYIYKAWWSDEAFVHLCGKRYEYRAQKVTDVTVYSNQSEVSLYNNGKLVETKRGAHAFHFKVTLEAENRLEVRSGELTDAAVIYQTKEPRPEYKVKKGKVKTGYKILWMDTISNIGGNYGREEKEYKARKKAYNKARRKAIRPWKGLTIFSALVAIIMIPLYTVLAMFDNTMAVFVGGTFWDLENEDENAQYFTSDFASVEEMTEYGLALCQQVEEEGAALLMNENQALPLAKGSKVSLFSGFFRKFGIWRYRIREILTRRRRTI